PARSSRPRCRCRRRPGMPSRWGSRGRSGGVRDCGRSVVAHAPPTHEGRDVMASRNGSPNDRPNIGTTPFLEGLQALEGEEMPADHDTVLDPDEIEERRVPTQTEFDRLDPDGRLEADADEIDGLGGGLAGE